MSFLCVWYSSTSDVVFQPLNTNYFSFIQEYDLATLTTHILEIFGQFFGKAAQTGERAARIDVQHSLCKTGEVG